MSKIESRDYWVSDACLEDIKGGYKITNRYLTNLREDATDIKITFSWQAPEKVVTISESEFDEAVRVSMLGGCPYKFAENIKEKLFKGEVENDD